MPDFSLEFSPDGFLRLRGSDSWREAKCADCREPIMWVLDMFSFSSGPDFKLLHAYCAWLPEAFDRGRERAQQRAHERSRENGLRAL